MDFDLFLLAGSKSESTKSLIIKCLAANPSLSTAEIHSLLKKRFSKSVSYQAIRQSLHELVQAGVLRQDKKAYAISPSWVLDLKDMADLLERSMKRRQVRVVDRETTQARVKNLFELGHFVLFGLDRRLFDLSEKADGKGELLLQLEHLWIPFSDLYRRERLVAIFRQNRTTVVVRGKTAADKMLALWYKGYGKVILGTRIPAGAQCIVHGDCVIQIFMPESLRKRMDEVYSVRGMVKRDLFRRVTDMTYDECGIDLVITRNKDIAEQVRERILALAR